jgi:hypothetical protein
VVCPPDAPEDCFDLSLVPFQAGGRSIYSDRPDGLFRDEFAPALAHARGAVSMSNPGRADANGSQFFVTIAPPSAPLAHLDGKYVVFAQVLEGFEIMEALGAVGRKDGTTLQRVVCEECGVLPAGWEPPAAGAARGAGAAAAAASASGVLRSGERGVGRATRAVVPRRAPPLLPRRCAAAVRAAPPPARRAAPASLRAASGQYTRCAFAL